MTDESKVVVCRNLSKSYRMPHGDIQVLKDVSLSVSKGEHLCLMGASGAGKSTLLHLLAGLDTPDTGTIEIDGVDFGALTEAKRARFRASRIGVVFQSYHLMPDLNVLENVMVPARALTFGMVTAPKALRSRAEYLLDQVGLSHRLLHRPRELSGGEQQRVGIARSLINKPDLLFADEPTGNLDAETGSKVLDQLFALGEELGVTLVAVTHSPQVGERCTRRLDLLDGCVNG